MITPTKRPRLLDLFCGAGGCSVGYHRAGFDVVGVDNRPMPRYPFAFIQADALELLSCLKRGGKFHVQDGEGGEWGPSYYLEDFDAIHASPPCQAYTPLRALCGERDYPDMVAAVRAALEQIGKPWVIENVSSAPVMSTAMLCGTMFGLRVYRHRRFESTVFLWNPPHPQHKIRAGAPGTKGGRGRKAHYMAGGFVTVCGNVGSYAGPAMGIDWMTGDELSQSIPPAYTEFVGKQLLNAITEPNPSLCH